MSSEPEAKKAKTSGCPVDFSSTFFVDSLKSSVRKAIINGKANACPMGIRLAWHQSGTFDKSDGSGGSNGATMRYEPEASHGANAGLSIIRDMLKPVLAEHPNVPISDIWALTGKFACEFLGGPKIDVRIGRTDKPEGPSDRPDGRLPDASQGAEHLREIFYRQGFNDQEIVALSGAHTLGRCHRTRSGYDGPWTQNPLKFDNSYFSNLINMKWKPREWDGPLQYENENGKYMMLPTDMALITDEKFKPFVEMYANDEAAFFRDFAAAFSKLISNGCNEQCQPKEDDPVKLASDMSAQFREHCMHGSLEHAKKCIADGGDVSSLENNSGRTGLMKAAFWGHDHVVKHLVSDLGANTDVQDVEGDSALHDAARFGHLGCITILVEAGADTTLKNKKGQTAATVAEEYGQAEAVALLTGNKLSSRK